MSHGNIISETGDRVNRIGILGGHFGGKRVKMDNENIYEIGDRETETDIDEMPLKEKGETKMTGLTRIGMTGNNEFTGFKHSVYEIFKKKSHIYIARGEFLADDIPDDIDALMALISGTNSPMLPLGDMDTGGSNITWTEQTVDTDFSTLGSGYEINGTFVGITINQTMFRFINELGDHRYSFLFVPEGVDNVFFAISGVNVTTEGNLGIVEDGLAKITFKIKRKANKLTDVIKFAKLSE